MSVRNVIAVHGGAWSIPEHLWKDSIDGVKDAVRAGYSVLQSGGTSLDAVEAAVVTMEDNIAFDAGTGSVLTYDEQVEMDALIMEGEEMKAGAVACIKNIRNPIRVAMKVLKCSPHVLLVGEGANKFAEAYGFHEVDPDELVTVEAKESLEKYKKFNTAIDCLFDNSDRRTGCDTVGCVALDSSRHVACATSTGGITAKMPGRVGDSPLVGCGGIADDESGAVSTTGHGEAIIKVCLAKTVLNNVVSGNTACDSISSALNYMKGRVKGYGGAIAVSRLGDVGAAFTTEKMPWAFIKDNKLHYGIHVGQHDIEDIS